jgi:hypothetical protein
MGLILILLQNDKSVLWRRFIRPSNEDCPREGTLDRREIWLSLEQTGYSQQLLYFISVKLTTQNKAPNEFVESNATSIACQFNSSSETRLLRQDVIFILSKAVKT